MWGHMWVCKSKIKTLLIKGFWVFLLQKKIKGDWKR